MKSASDYHLEIDQFALEHSPFNFVLARHLPQLLLRVWPKMDRKARKIFGKFLDEIDMPMLDEEVAVEVLGWADRCQPVNFMSALLGLWKARGNYPGSNPRLCARVTWLLCGLDTQTKLSAGQKAWLQFAAVALIQMKIVAERRRWNEVEVFSSSISMSSA